MALVEEADDQDNRLARKRHRRNTGQATQASDKTCKESIAGHRDYAITRSVVSNFKPLDGSGIRPFLTNADQIQCVRTQVNLNYEKNSNAATLIKPSETGRYRRIEVRFFPSRPCDLVYSW